MGEIGVPEEQESFSGGFNNQFHHPSINILSAVILSVLILSAPSPAESFQYHYQLSISFDNAPTSTSQSMVFPYNQSSRLQSTDYFVLTVQQSYLSCAIQSRTSFQVCIDINPALPANTSSLSSLLCLIGMQCIKHSQDIINHPESFSSTPI